MWKAIMRSALEAFAMSDPVCYMHYLECKREAERQDEAGPYRAPNRQQMLRPIDGASRSRKEISA